jgi:hypothetical protein
MQAGHRGLEGVVIGWSEDFPGETTHCDCRENAFGRVDADGFLAIEFPDGRAVENVPDRFITVQPQGTIRRNLVDLFRADRGFRFGRRKAFGGIARGLGLRLAGKLDHITVAAGEEKTAQFEYRVSAAGSFNLTDNGFEGAGFREQAGAPAGERFNVRTIVEPAGAAVTIVAEIRASAFAAVRSPAAVIAGWAAGAGATIILTRATGRAVGPGTARAIRPGTTGTGWAGSPVILTGSTGRTIGAWATGWAAAVAAVEIRSVSEATGAAFAAGTTRAETLAATARFPFMLRSASPDDFAGSGFALLQVSDPIGGEAEVLQLGEVDGFWIRHIRRRKSVRLEGVKPLAVSAQALSVVGLKHRQKQCGACSLRMPCGKSILFRLRFPRRIDS